MRMLPIRVAGLMAGFMILAAASASAAERLVVREAQGTVKEAMDRLAKSLDEKGIKVVARVDHAAAAKANGLDLPPTEVIMFGNPKLGTPLMQANRLIGIDLPMRVLAWQDAKGKTWIGYTAPKALAARHGVKRQDATVAALTAAVDGLVQGAAVAK